MSTIDALNLIDKKLVEYGDKMRKTESTDRIVDMLLDIRKEVLDVVSGG